MVDDDVLLLYVVMILARIDGHVARAELSRLLRCDLMARRVSADELRACCARVSEHDFLAVGAGRRLWELHADGVRPIQTCRAVDGRGLAGVFRREAGNGRGQSGRRECALPLLQLGAAVAATSLLGFSVVGIMGMLAGATVGGLEILAAWIAGWWILSRVHLPRWALTRPDVLVPAVTLLFVFLVFLYR